jgi:hypothetical protein
MRQRKVQKHPPNGADYAGAHGFLMPGNAGAMIGWSVSEVVHFLIYLGCGLLLIAVLILGIVELIRMAAIRTNVNTLLNYTNPYLACDDDHSCCTQWDCPVLAAADVRELTAWNDTDPDTFFNLTRSCLFGACYYKYQLQLHAPNFTELCAGEAGHFFFEDVNYYYNETNPDVLSELVFNGWDSPLSHMCYAFITTASRDPLLKANINYLYWDNTFNNLSLTCFYTYACIPTFNIGGSVDFPIHP